MRDGVRGRAYRAVELREDAAISTIGIVIWQYGKASENKSLYDPDI